MQVLVEPPWRRPSMRGIEANIPRTLTKLSHVLPLPKGEGRGEGEGISLSFTAFFSAVGSALNSTENSEELLKNAKEHYNAD